MAIGFNIQFRINEKTQSRVIRLTDTSTGFTFAKGNFSIVHPDGSSLIHTDFDNPDISSSGAYYEFQASTDIYNNVLTGQYTITFVAKSTSLVEYTLARTFDFNWIKPAADIQNRSDVFIPQVQFFDNTSYTTIGSFTGTLTRTFSVPFPSTSEVPSQPTVFTSTNTLTPVYSSKYYEGLYNTSLDVIVNYTHAYSWLTIYYTNLSTKTFDIRQVPNQVQLVTKLNTFRAVVDSYREKNDTQFEILSEEYDIAIALYSHLVARFQTGTLDGSQPLLEELLSILEPYGGAYTYKSTQLTPFVLNESGGQSFNISDGANLDVIPMQSTLTFASGNPSFNILVADNSVTYTPIFGSTTNTFAAGNDARFHNSVTIGTANGLSLSTQVLSLAVASSGSAGAMSAADKVKLDGVATGATANVGTVTSVGISMPSAFTVTGSPVTVSGTLTVVGAGSALQYIKGDGGLATLNTAAVAESTNLYFTTGRSRSSISLTTSGTSGASTYNPTTGVLNIPQYTGNVTSFNTRTGDIVLSSSDVTTALTFTPENAANKGIANGYASLDGGGLIPATQLPSYVDDVLEYTNLAGFPATGTTGKIYVALDTNKIYRWSGSTYIEVSPTVGTIWGGITGTLSNQTDLQSALNAKQNTLSGTGFVKSTAGTISYDTATYYPYPIGTTSQYIAGDGSLVAFPIAGTSGTIVRLVRNQTGATLTKGTVVYISGATGNNPTVSKAISSSDSTSAQTFGLCQTDIANNATGYVVSVGDLIGIDTSAFTEGQQLYLSSTVAGTYTTTKQYAPAHLVYIGVITRSHPTLGQIEVRIQNGYEMDELHNVSAQTPSNNDGIFWESSTSLWKNKSIATVLGYTPANAARTLTINGTAYDLTADRSWSVGTVTSVAALTLGTTGTDLSSSVATGTTTPVITLNVPTASATNRGALSSADWTTFNNKQATITLTTTGSSGSATFVTNTLNIPTYTLSGLGGQASSTNLTSLSGLSYVSASFVKMTAAGTFSLDTNTYALASNISGTTNYVPKFTSASTLGNSLIYDNGTNVGINTISPTTRLTIDNSGNANTNAIDLPGYASTSKGHIGQFANGLFLTSNYYYASGQNYDTATLGQSAIIISAGTTNTSFIVFNLSDAGATSPSEKMRLTSAGNLGLGTSSPSAKLTVQGLTSDQIRVYEVTDSANYYKIGRNSSTGYLDFYGNQSGYVGYLFGGVDGTRMTLNSSGNLGLGVTPSAWSVVTALQVGTASINSVSSGANAGFSVNRYFDGGANRYITNGFASNYEQYNGGHAWYSAPSGTAGTAISFTQAMTLDASGNLGIGTSSPSGYGGGYPTMDLRGSTGSGIKIGNSTDVSYLYANSTATYLRTASSKPLIFGTFDTERMQITSGGNYLIGTTTDSGYKLDVNGTGRFSGNVTVGLGNALESLLIINGQTYSGLRFSRAGTTKWAIFNNNAGTDFIDFYNYTTNSSAFYISATNAATFSSSVNATSISAGSGTNQAFLGAGTLGFYNAASSPKYIQLLDDASTINAIGFSKSGSTSTTWFPSGNVGIGTTSPARPLDVNGTMRIADGSSIEWGGVSAAISGTSASNALLFYTSSSERMRITSTGLVGIGTTNPGANLVVQNSSGTSIPSLGASGGHFQLQNGTYGLLAGVSGAGNAWMQVQRTDSTATTYNLLLQPSGGNVGIGTTSPAEILHLARYGTTTLEVQNTRGSSIGYFSVLDSEIQLQSGTNHPLTFLTYGTERMRITSGGNILIGTTTDSGYKLDVNGGNLRVKGSTNEQLVLDYTTVSGNFTWQSFRINGTNKYRIFGNTDNSFALYSDIASAQVLTIASTGAATFSSLGTGTVYSNSGTLTNTNPSDRKLKKNITSITYGLSDILKLNPVSYEWKDGSNGKQFGFIAQEVQDVMPDAVKDGEYLGLEKDAIYASLVNAIKELKAELDILKNK